MKERETDTAKEYEDDDDSQGSMMVYEDVWEDDDVYGNKQMLPHAYVFRRTS